jgi:hypothetical protein
MKKPQTIVNSDAVDFDKCSMVVSTLVRDYGGVSCLANFAETLLTVECVAVVVESKCDYFVRIS